MTYNPTGNNCVKHNKHQPHFSAKISLVSLSLFSALSAPAWADVTLTQEEYNTLISRITQLEEKMGKNGAGGTAVGNNAQATKTDAIAMGTKSKATEINTTALGAYAEATDQYGIAVGADAYSVGERAIAIGVHTSEKEMKKFYDDPNKLRESLNYDSTIKSNITDQAVISELTNATQGETKLAELIKDDARLKQLIPDQKKRDAFIAYAKSVAEARATLDKQKALYPKNPELARFGLANPFGATGGKAIAIGDESLASGSYSVALGAESKATNYASIATGYKAKATGVQALANGFAAEAGGDYSLAIGTAAKVEESSQTERSIAIGYGAQSKVGLSIAIGAGAKNDSIKQGSPFHSAATAIGYDSYTGGVGSVALGNLAKANVDHKNYGIALGTGSIANGTRAVSIGTNAETGGENSTAVGDRAKTIGIYSTALGATSLAWGHYSIAIGTQVDQQGRNTAYGTRGFGSMAIGLYTYSHGIYSIAQGQEARANYNSSIALGYQSQANAVKSIAMGDNAQTTGVNSVALGPSAMATFDSTVALGDNSLANTKSDVIGFDPLGYASTAYNATKPETLLKDMSTVLSTEKLEAYNNLRAKIIELDEKIFSYNEILKVSEYDRLYGKTEDIRNKASETTTKIRKNRDDAIAAKKLALAEIQANYNDANTWRSSAGAVSVGNSDLGITRQITNVAAGSEDTDAVNVAQLKALAAAPVLFYNSGSGNGANFNIGTPLTQLGSPFNLTNLRFSFGNGLKASLQKDKNNNQVLFMELDSDAIKTNPDLKGQNGRDGRDGKDGQNGRDGINGRDGRDGNSLTPNDIVNVKEVHTGNTVMNTNGVTINTGNKTVSITENGLNNGGNKVVNVAAGEISAISKEAVNGQQLYETNQSVAQNTRAINQLNNKMDEVDRRGRRGVAIAGAMGLLPQPHTSGRSSISTATTYYRGEQALAVGYSRLADNGKHIVKFSGASNMSGKKDVMVGAAYGYEW